VSEPFDVGAYIDSLGPMTPEQRAVIDDAMSLAVGPDDGDDVAFLRDAALFLTTLVLVGGATTLDDDGRELIDAIRTKHRGSGPHVERR